PDSTKVPGRANTEVTPYYPIDDGLLLNQLPIWVPDSAIRHKILVDNPARLYGFKDNARASIRKPLIEARTFSAACRAPDFFCGPGRLMAAKIARSDLWVVHEGCRRPGKHDFPGLQDVAVVCGLERGAGVLLNEQDGHP